jgi:hypothetical protein
MGLELGPLSLMSTVEELLGRNSSGSGLESREYVLGDKRRSLDHSAGMVRSRTKITEFSLV